MIVVPFMCPFFVLDDGFSPAEGVGAYDTRWQVNQSTSVSVSHHLLPVTLFSLSLIVEVQTCPADKFRRTLSGMYVCV